MYVVVEYDTIDSDGNVFVHPDGFKDLETAKAYCLNEWNMEVSEEEMSWLEWRESLGNRVVGCIAHDEPEQTYYLIRKVELNEQIQVVKYG